MPNVPKPCEDCFIVRAEPDLVYEDGTPANLDTGLMLHHALLFNTGRTDTTCGKDTFFGGFGERFLASGNERTIKHFPAGYGYHLGRDPVTGVFHIMNHSAETKTVSFTFKVSWLPASTPGMRPVTPVWVDMENCRTSEYAVPAGPSSEHWTWKSTHHRSHRLRRRARPQRRCPHHAEQRHEQEARLHVVGRLRPEARLHGHDRVDELLPLGRPRRRPGR